MTKKLNPSEHKARIKKLEQEAQNSIWHRLKLCETREEKEELVRESNNLLYVFGGFLRAWKGWKSYEENMNEMYLGSIYREK